jgi:hypothetical protein
MRRERLAVARRLSDLLFKIVQVKDWIEYLYDEAPLHLTSLAALSALDITSFTH